MEQNSFRGTHFSLDKKFRLFCCSLIVYIDNEQLLVICWCCFYFILFLIILILIFTFYFNFMFTQFEHGRGTKHARYGGRISTRWNGWVLCSKCFREFWVGSFMCWWFEVEFKFFRLKSTQKFLNTSKISNSTYLVYQIKSYWSTNRRLGLGFIMSDSLWFMYMYSFTI